MANAGFAALSDVFRNAGTPVRGGIVAVCDHASNEIPPDVDLGIARELLEKHIAWDIGTAGVVETLADRHHIAGFLACVSRLVIDLHREPDSPGLIPAESDGHLIPGNMGADRESRLARFHRPYHAAMADFITAAEPRLILSIHSFTSALESAPQARPWDVGLLYNQDVRAARIAIGLFAEMGLSVGDNQPYSGRLLNATMNRHAEAQGRPYLAIEIRNDLIAEDSGQKRWAAMIAGVARRTVQQLE